MVPTSPASDRVSPTPSISDEWICPDIRPYWQLAQVKQDSRVVLRCPQSGDRHLFSDVEGYALRYFTGKYSIQNIQQRCQAEFTLVDSQLVVQLIQKLLRKGILAFEALPAENRPQLKSGVQWVKNADGYWILRNRGDRTYLQVAPKDQAAIVAYLNGEPTNVSPAKLRQLLQLLSRTGMLEGTTPPKRPRGKFNPMQLLFFKVPLFNPDPWLNRHINGLRWIWTKGAAWFLMAVLVASLIVGISESANMAHWGMQLWSQQGGQLTLPFVLLIMAVVSIHELGHSFTLKHYGGMVPEIGLLFMCLFPAAYTDTSDSYCLSRWQRIQVVGAGVLTQFIIAAIALWSWQFAVEGSWLSTSSYLLMMAALLTVALNLNPLAKFDGYHLAVAVTGINNLRSRSFTFYKRLFSGQPRRERPSDARVLALYAPLSLLYISMVFGLLFLRLGDWTLTNIPAIALTLITLWAIYFFLMPDPE